MRRWALEKAQRRPELIRAGYFGSYARGDWGVGSDLDLVIVVERCEDPFERRAASWDLTQLPVPAEAIIYTIPEWDRLSGRFKETLDREAVWVYEKESGGGWQPPRRMPSCPT